MFSDLKSSIISAFNSVVGSMPDNIRKETEESVKTGKSVEMAALKYAIETGASEDDARKLAAATYYSKLEEQGVNLDEFWNGIPEEQRQQLRFSPESLRQEFMFDSFLGIAEVFLWIVAAFAGGIALLRGIPVSVKTVIEARRAIALGKGVQEVANIINLGRLAAISKVAVPGLIAAIATGLAWATQGLLQTLGDPIGWGRRSISTAEQKFIDVSLKLQEEAKKEEARQQVSMAAQAAPSMPEMIRISKTKTGKPKMFIGIIMAGKVTEAKEFVRKLDDIITDDADLINDVIINMTEWIKSLPGKLTYEVQLKYNPFDEFNERKLGYWATLGIYISNRYGKRMFLDDILLGPVDPLTYTPVVGESQSISGEVAKTLMAAEIKPTGLSSGEVRTLTEEGNIVDVFPHAPAPGTAGATPSILELEKQKAELEAKKAELEAEVKKAMATQTPSLAPTPAPAPAAQTPAAPTPAVPEIKSCATMDCSGGDAIIFNTQGEGLNLRESPTTKSNIIKSYSEGIRTYVMFNAGANDGYDWVRVSMLDGNQGYMASKYLRKI